MLSLIYTIVSLVSFSATKNCIEDEFQCNNEDHLQENLRCDGDDDCEDGSDEHGGKFV